jgi:hypothetical protein
MKIKKLRKTQLRCVVAELGGSESTMAIIADVHGGIRANFGLVEG